ncbi:QcrA and Rieske domain-containing protein [Parapedobacter koreensis]|nr:Rieske 2Fe-2S domain-containing protein [Parapedobacter koreensis]
MVKLSPDAGRVLTVPETSFVEGVEMLVVRTNTLENDILLRKVGERYLALYLHCTHEGVGLTPTAERIYCHAHGSVFDLEGQVVKEPAFEPLKTFKTEFNNHQILIYLT